MIEDRQLTSPNPVRMDWPVSLLAATVDTSINMAATCRDIASKLTEATI